MSRIARPVETSARTGRPVGFDRDAALDAAMQLFWRRGYRAVSASDLADAMGIRRSSFYNSFGSREGVFLAALERYGQLAPDRPLDVIPSGAPVLPVLEAVFRDLCRARARDKEARGCLVCNSMADLVGVDKALGPVIRDAAAARLASLERLLARAVDQGELPAATDVPNLSRAILAFLIGLNTLSKVIRSERQLWGTAERFLRQFGLLKETP